MKSFNSYSTLANLLSLTNKCITYHAPCILAI